MTQLSGRNRVTVLFILAAAVFYGAMSLFAGIPTGSNQSGFIIGLVALFVVLTGFMLFTFWAVVRPLPAGVAPSSKLPLTRPLRQGVALFLLLMSAVGIAGGLWDVTWHVESGLPFGEDFFWEPHQFIYVALFAPIAISAFLWYRMLNHSSGTLRQRLKADIPVTLLLLGGVSMALALPADPLWHALYGEDLTGLSVPHLVFSVSSTLSFLGLGGILLSYTPARTGWDSIMRITRMELLIVVGLALTLVSLLLPTLGDWEAIALPADALVRLPALVEARPDWALPFMAAFVTLFTGGMAVRITRRAGTALLMWVIGSGFRAVLLVIFGYDDTGLETMLFVLPFIAALDGAAWLSARRGQPLRAAGVTIAATIAGSLVTIPLIGVIFTDPILSAGNVVTMIPAIAVASLIGWWMGDVLGSVVAATPRFAVTAAEPVVMPRVTQTVWAVALLIIAVAAFFILNSTVPTA